MSILALLLATPVPAAPVDTGTTIDLAAEASRPAANDLARATVFAEASGTTPGDLATRVNGLIAAGLKTARGYSNIKAQSGATHTYPVYAKGSTIEGWRMRSDLTLETGDTAALSDLLGKLQTSMGIANLMMLPAPETRKKAESEAMIDAIAAFKSRAKVIADTLGKPYRIKHLVINNGGQAPLTTMMRSAGLAAAQATPMPIEAGDTQISATVAGQIELLE
ncbi:SIMPL domain-containing protein [Candidatus Accumulibacter aalborgensis]|uniref:SIMPL domain-containing protein n=1 Tax=Candidatus Accumulibacter aalborgensis TaxID=1860102 RepID=UPI001FE10167|nr:SIMPL domain-containing protein [Candidatus Accumulibacter aalborgensis]